jgi:hypothetical protein
MWDPESTKNILEMCKNGQHPPEFEENSLHAIYKPFWADLPHSNIFLAFTPDLLHQLHKGVFKDHLVKWCIDIVGEEEMDVRFKAVPDYPGLHHFKKGISTIKQWTGREHKEINTALLLTPIQVLLPICRGLVGYDFVDWYGQAGHFTWSTTVDFSRLTCIHIGFLGVISVVECCIWPI